MTTELLGPVFVKGSPAAFATAGEVRWKENVADTLAPLWRGKSYVESPCEMEFTFHLSPLKVAVTDVDNLLKPAVDAVGSVIFKPARIGHRVRWNVEDYWIYRVSAEKTCEGDAERVGMGVTVRGFQPVGYEHVQTG